MEADGDMKQHGITHVGIRSHDIRMQKADEKYVVKTEENDENFRISAVVERKIEAPFDSIYVVRLKEKGNESVRVEISKSTGEKFEEGQKVVLDIPKEKLLRLRG